ncbi:MAG TPA: phosphoglycerate dehydrogenase [Chloroflexota bacterium]|nr:phosphoglycerate dehydrogenase [Chloroflexota bacterium]
MRGRTISAPHRIVIADPIAAEGVQALREHAEVVLAKGRSPVELKALLRDADALVVRSQTQVDAALIADAPRLRVIGRAGIGVDNVDVEAASRRGIVVVNAPTSVVVAAAEHTLALILSLCRRIPQAHQSLTAGRWERGRFVGTELRGKTVGVIGLGNIGVEVARRLGAFEVRLIGYDPYVSPEYAARLGIQLLDLDELVARADIVTVHVPLTAGTHHLIDATRLARFKSGARLINCARGEIVDERAVADALAEGRLAGAALDVFASEPPDRTALLESDRVVLTPHLGASTEEAQVAAAVEIADSVLALLDGRPVRSAVNAPSIRPESLVALAPYLDLGERLGYVMAQLLDRPITSLEIGYHGEIADWDTVVVKSAIVKGLLRAASPEYVNLMNALLLAKSRGLQIVESHCATPQENVANLVSLKVREASGLVGELAGTAVNREPHLLRVDTYHIDVLLDDGYLLFVQHKDQPGVVGKIGTLLGDGDVNISAMQVGRRERRGDAMMVLAIDEPLDEALRQRLLGEPPIRAARLVQLTS